MSILFIHGVNVREDRPDYGTTASMRRTLFERVVVPRAREMGHAGFGVEPDVYWGDLGAGFAWGRASVPRSGLEALGADGEAPPHPALVELVAEGGGGAARDGDVEPLGPARDQPLAAAARRKPGRLVAALVAPLLEEPSADGSPPGASTDGATGAATPQEEGVRLALLALAADAVIHDEAALAELRGSRSDQDAVDRTERLLEAQIERLAPASEDGVEMLGPRQWARALLRRAADAAESAVRWRRRTVPRALSLVALRALRGRFTGPALLFFGDVFAYLHGGRATSGDSISRRVEAAVRDAAADPARKGPLVVVTHSFGSMILYDLLTTGRLDDVRIDLWVTAGAQVSLFAEMRLFTSSPADVPGPQRRHLGRPAQVRRWVNVYDAADVLSYLMEPVFGADAVRDVSFREGAHLLNAHGNYFAEPAFYRLVAAEMRDGA